MPADRRANNGANRRPGEPGFHAEPELEYNLESESGRDSRHDVGNHVNDERQTRRYRAIKRAPEHIRKLYENNCLGETEAARLGLFIFTQQLCVAFTLGNCLPIQSDIVAFFLDRL